MPKQRITKEMVVQAAYDLAREGGMEAVLVKSIAQRLGCSVQPVYSYCQDMGHLREEVMAKIKDSFDAYLRKKRDPADIFYSVGMAHATFAREEPHLFRLYFQRPQTQAKTLEELYAIDENAKVVEWLAADRGITMEQAQELHLQLMIYNSGLSFLLASLGENVPLKQVGLLLRQAGSAFAMRL